MKTSHLARTAALALIVSLGAIGGARADGRVSSRFTFPALRFDSDQYGVSLGWSKDWTPSSEVAPPSRTGVLYAQSIFLRHPQSGTGMHVSVQELSVGRWNGTKQFYEPEKSWLLRSGQPALRFRVKGGLSDDRYVKTCLLPIRGEHRYIRVDVECARRDIRKCIGEMNRILDSLALFKRTPRFV